MNRYFTVILFAGSPRYDHDRKVISAFLQKNELRPTCGTVLVLDGPPRMESVLDVLQDELLSDLVLFAPGADSEELAVRLSVRKGGTSMTDVLSIAEDLQAGCAAADPDRSEPEVPAISIVRNVYNGHLTGTFTLEDGPFFLALDRKLLGEFYYEGKDYEFNFSKFWTLSRTKFDCWETEDEIHWHVVQTTFTAKMDSQIVCKKADMLNINYEAPNGTKRHNRLWNGGTGTGVLKLYRRVGKKEILIDEIEAANIGCEYGEYDR
jgi:hypothetical protein